MKENEKENESVVREIALSQLFLAVWKRRLIIFLVVLIALAGSLVYSLIVPKVYQCQGFFNRDMTIVDYKRLMGLLQQPKDLLFSRALKERVIDKLGLTDDSIGRAVIDVKNAISPIYTVTREDSRAAVMGVKKDDMVELMGVRISATGRTPELARARVLFLGEYIRDRLSYLVLYEYLNEKNDFYQKNRSVLSNELMELKFTIGQLRNKLSTIMELSKRYPRGDFAEGRQVISVKDEGYRYLSPSVQAMGIEAEIAEFEQKRDKVSWQKEKAIVLNAFFADMCLKLDNMDSGIEIFDTFSKAIDDLGREADIQSDVMALVLNELNMDRQSFEADFFKNSRFLSNPILPRAPIKPNKITIVGLMTFLALICSVGVVMVREMIRMLGGADRDTVRC